jgi:hypothetical protein
MITEKLLISILQVDDFIQCIEKKKILCLMYLRYFTSADSVVDTQPPSAKRRSPSGTLVLMPANQYERIIFPIPLL